MEKWRLFFYRLLAGGRRKGEGAAEAPSRLLAVEQLPVETLAYIGDAVYELFVRTDLVSRGLCRGEDLHREAVRRVRASAQAQKLSELLARLTEEERELVRRGRNAKTGQVPRGARVIEYRHSTAFEVLLGYLFLKGKWDRLEEILTILADEGNPCDPGPC
ncbi:MAG TPA: ribonuclease III [Firmicutes bacterium]|nr:ribonuclease III [Bacillota bacterium]